MTDPTPLPAQNATIAGGLDEPLLQQSKGAPPCGTAASATAAESSPLFPAEVMFASPGRGFVSLKQPHPDDWQEGILTGNGTLGAIVMGHPHDEKIYLSHAALYLPYPNSERYLEMASRLGEIRRLCLAGDFGGAAGQISAAREEFAYKDQRDPFIGAFMLRVQQPASDTGRYQRAVDFMTAETLVSVEEAHGGFLRSVFASRPDGILALRLAGTGKQTAEFSFNALPPRDEKEKKVIDNGVRSSAQGVKDGLLYFRTLFAHENEFNPNAGYEGIGKVIAKGGTRTETVTGIHIKDADEIVVLVAIEPLPKTAGADSIFAAVRAKLDALPGDYSILLATHAKAHGELMGRVSLSLDASAADRAKPSEQLNKESEATDAPLAKIERAFDAGRYNIICCTGLNPPNLQGLWSATWLAPWSGSFTTNGNLPAAVAFLLMGNTPELMQSYFRYNEDRLPGFRENAQRFYGTRGFHIPAQLTLSPRETDFNPSYPHNFWHGGAAWVCQFYYDYFQYTGDRKFLEDRAYPLMKEAASFYEDFLTVDDKDGKLVFVPSYSPENAPGGEEKVATAINATMEISAAKQLLRNAIASAKLLGRDGDLQEKWADIIARLPSYEAGPDGDFREWLWPDLEESNEHRHASHLYALYDEMPSEIVDNPALVAAVEHTIKERMKFREVQQTGMAFGIVQLGLAAAHIGNAEWARQTINLLAKSFWSSGMASFHDIGNLFNMDISGGFPYLCASALVYSEPGLIRLFPGRPAQWKSGSLKGVRLRGGITVRNLTWNGSEAEVILVSNTDQTIRIEVAGSKTTCCRLHAGEETKLERLQNR